MKKYFIESRDVQKLFNVTEAIIMRIEGKHLVFESWQFSFMILFLRYIKKGVIIQIFILSRMP